MAQIHMHAYAYPYIYAHMMCAKGVIGVNDDHPVMEAVSSPDWQAYTATILAGRRCVEMVAWPPPL
uniref:Uncharacterized protein n=1 Tax=Rhodnius prolixus TaxID=13249 RepID=T1IBG5_RHOPR